MQIQNALLTGSTTVYGPITFVSGSIIGSSSYAQTSSYADTFTVAGSLTAQTLVVQTITSSVSFITGSTRFGSLLTNTHTFTGSMFVTGSAINLSNSKIIIGDDGTYGGNISTVGFGGTSNGFNRIAAANNTSDGLYLIAATGRGIYFRPAGKSTQDLSVFPNGNTALGVNFLLPTATLHISGSGSGSLMQISSTVSSSIFFVSGSGNVGIGTATPNNLTDIVGSTAGDGGAFNGTGAILRVKQNATWGGNQPWALYVEGYSYLNGFRINASDGVRALYKTAAGGTLGFATTGNDPITFTQLDATERMRIAAGGNVGIGLTDPSALLHISGSGSGSLMRISSHVSSSIFFVSGSGNVGIGTTSPQSILHAVKSNSTAPTSGTTPSGYALSYGVGDGNNGGIWFSTDFGGDQGIAGIAGTRVSGYQTDLRFYTNDTNSARAFTERMRITSGGNVGIATTTIPNNLGVALQMGSTVNFMSYVGNAYFLNNWYYDSSGNAKYITSNFASGITQNGSGELRFFTNASGTANATFTPTERLMITNGGNVGIGTISPQQKLHVEGSAAIGTTGTEDILILGRALSGGVSFQQAASLKLGRYQNAGGAYESYTRLDIALRDNSAANNYNTNTTVMTLNNAGNVLIGKTAASVANVGCELNGNGTATFAFAITSNEAVIYNNTTTGTTYQIDFRTNSVERGSISVTDSAVAFNTTSDYRIKEDFKQFNGLEKLANIKVYDFKFKDLEERMDGVIAHELQEVLPYAVIGVKDGEKLQGVDYSKLVPVLIKSIQELSTKLEEATTRIKTLESR